MNDFDLLTDDDVPEMWEEGEDGRERCLSIHSPKGHIVDLEAIGEVSDPSASRVLVGDDDNFVSTINEFLPYPFNILIEM